MKFLGKKKDSLILVEGLTYKKGGDNKRLNELLLEEQKNFCAYTEKYMEGLDSSEVEHFNSAIKYEDNYYNYYAVIRKANLYKKDEKYKNASFFNNLFFQDEILFTSRIKYVDGVYEEVDLSDTEAKNFIDFLGFNHPILYNQRKRHIDRLKNYFKDASYSPEQCIEHFRNYKEQLSFITAVAKELDIDLSEFYK